LARVLNRASAIAHSVGIWPSRLATLKVPGRRTGRVISFPVVIADHEGDRYLVAMLGEKTNRAGKRAGSCSVVIRKTGIWGATRSKSATGAWRSTGMWGPQE
jgi:hypothetical protein